MAWRIIKSDSSGQFLTNDNPVFFSESEGLEHPDGEFSLPLAGDIAMYGCWDRPETGLLFVNGTAQLVKDINRRVVFGATGFLFYQQEAGWLSKLASNPRRMLKRLPRNF